MITEKPSWIRHEGLQIFSIDIQPGSLRFATGGGDQKVRIWNMKLVGKDVTETDESAGQRLLATVRDHFGSVNCVRWARHGRYLASGSDDQMILIHERKAGSATVEFGSGEPPDVENWKVIMTLRGHNADVVDLNWSPDDSTLVSGSLDNTVHVWNMSNGICMAVLRGHSSLVKGVTWDPIGSFIASQSDDKTVIIWQTSDWSLAHRTEGHWSKSVGSTFFRRLSWSPCGHFITTTHGFQKPRHSAPVLERGEWSATFDFLGHNAPIIVVKFNHSMFRKHFSNNTPQDSKAGPAAAGGWANGGGGSKGGGGGNGKELQPYNVIAIGSQDRTITVWTTASARPLFVAKHFFSQSVVDLSWSPDGYSLFACSLDGTVATFHFEVKELGHRLTDAELDELKRSRYGDVRGRQAHTLAESPAQLLLEAVSVKHSSSAGASKKTTTATPAAATTTTTATTAPNGAHQTNQVPPPVNPNPPQKPPEAQQKDEGKKPERVTSPVRQREYRRPDGRKRIIPEAVGGLPPNQDNNNNNNSNGDNNNFSGRGSHTQLLDFAPDHQQEEGRRMVFAGGVDNNPRAGATARAYISESLLVQKMASKDGGGRMSVEHPGSSSGPMASCTAISIRVYNNNKENNCKVGEGEEDLPVCLEAKPIERSVTDVAGVSVNTNNALLGKETQINCTKGTEILWSDRIAGKVTVLAGNSNFWAVGSEDGCLQIYTKCGRRAMPGMMMGSAPVFIDCDESWNLLVVTRRALLYVWDLFNRSCILHDSLSSLLPSPDDSSSKDAGTIRVISAKLSRSGSPLVVLGTRHAYLYDMSLKCWLRIADDCFPASNFASSFFNLGSATQAGELSRLQVDAGKFMARRPTWTRVTDDGVQTRAHLETQLASSLALKSSNEYRNCLLSYIRFLAREGDESRLREVCESFLGPPAGMLHDPNNPVWDPLVLGMEKHKLLREDILPAMASNRKVQRLLNEFMDLLSEYESIETNLDKMEVVPPSNDSNT